ncbi:hypothetical protein QN239_27460 [Mycolicibacterium sp. Y3]
MTSNRDVTTVRKFVPRGVCERAYAGALAEPCGHCKAAPGDYCKRTDDYGQTHIRHIPCLHRIQPSLIVLDHRAPVPADFTEPRHPRNGDL